MIYPDINLVSLLLNRQKEIDKLKEQREKEIDAGSRKLNFEIYENEKV